MTGLIDSTTGLAFGSGLQFQTGIGGPGLGVSVGEAVFFNGGGTLFSDQLVGTPSPLFSMSMWINPRVSLLPGSRNKWNCFQSNAVNGVRPGGSTIFAEPGGGGPIFIYFCDATRANGVMWFGDDVTEMDEWFNILVSVDFSGGEAVMQCYFNDVLYEADIGFEDGTLPFNVDIFEETFYVQDWKLPGDTQPSAQDMCDVWMAAGQFIDFSVEANRRKFITADGKRVDLGSTGLIPTGVAPTFFFTGGPDTFVNNVGTGGVFETAGDPLVIADPPP